ncbi:MAG: ATP-binding protein [Spirochaetaceae bacterium]|jgi:predicted AAA+ superfamily ATPase|nr:ATP-binding protein [Spirochaetaceae bacterium]
MIDVKRESLYRILSDIAGLSLFSALKDHPLLRALEDLARALLRFQAPPEGPGGSALPIRGTPAQDALDILRHWTALTEALLLHCPAGGLAGALARLALTDENTFTRAAEAAAVTPLLRAAARGDLARLGRLAALDLPELGFRIAALLAEAGGSPEAGPGGFTEAASLCEAFSRALWQEEGAEAPAAVFPRGPDWAEALPPLEAYIRRQGAGILGQYHCFYGDGEGRLIPVRRPDPVALSSLGGYEDQRALVVANTLRFLRGKAANNLLLYGDRGTGKSATVKAVCNEYAPQGLKVVELHKSSLPRLPRILETLGDRALKFVVFIDDLSFESTGDSYTTLKALLEGGVEAKPPNVVVYATSNRRHLVKERFADRPTTAQAAAAADTGDVRAFDTMQEQFSLADRFGLTVVFAAPSQEEYLEIACFIAEKRGLLTAAGEAARAAYRENALRWERWFNGRSPRTAVQYADWVEGGEGFPWEGPGPR